MGSTREYPYHVVVTTSPWERKETARRRFIAAGILLTLLVAPLLWLIGLWAFLQGVPGGSGLFALRVLALVSVAAGIGLLIYGLVAKSDFERAMNEAGPKPKTKAGIVLIGVASFVWLWLVLVPIKGASFLTFLVPGAVALYGVYLIAVGRAEKRREAAS